MYLVLKIGALVIYALALLAFVLPLPGGLAFGVQLAAAILLVVHALEVLLVFKHVRLYKGALSISILLTLLFGFLHWKPLVDAARQDAAG